MSLRAGHALALWLIACGSPSTSSSAHRPVSRTAPQTSERVQVSDSEAICEPGALDEEDLQRIRAASFDAALCENLRLDLESLYGERCGHRVGLLRRPERGRWCAALLDTACSLAARRAESFLRDDPGRSGELFAELAFGSRRRCSPRPRRVWHYAVQARRAFESARRFQDAQRVDEALVEHPLPMEMVPHAPPWGH